MDLYFTSDLHLGHAFAAEKRGFASQDDHDMAVLNSLCALPKHSKLWILGDIAWGLKELRLLEEVPCETMDAVLGNHDKLHISQYQLVFDNVHGARSYKSFWLTHIPIHPQEICHQHDMLGNIHGHIHKGASTDELPLPYFNVNWDFHRGPVRFDDIVKAFEGESHGVQA